MRRGRPLNQRSSVGLEPTPNRTDRDVYDLCVTVNWWDYFSGRYAKRSLAHRAAHDLEKQYRIPDGKVTIKTVQPE